MVSAQQHAATSAGAVSATFMHIIKRACEGTSAHTCRLMVSAQQRAATSAGAVSAMIMHIRKSACAGTSARTCRSG